MKKKTKGIIIISILVIFLIVLGVYFIFIRNQKIEFYAKVTESFGTSSIIEPLSNESIYEDYPVLQIDVGNLQVGDLIKVSADKEFIKDYPPVARVDHYEFILNNTSSTTEFPKSSENTNDNVIEDNISTTKNADVTKKNNYSNQTPNYSTTKTTTTTKIITTTTKYVSSLTKDNTIINNLQSKINNVENNHSDKSFGETAKEYFITAVDFIFYNKDINGVYFNELTDSAKLKVISLVLKLDNIIEKYYPGYKEDVSSSYQNAKTKLIELYLDKTTEYCNNNDNVCNQAKSDFQDLKYSLNITWDVIKGIGNKGISKLKEWYEIYSGK